MNRLGRKFWIYAMVAFGGTLCQHVQAQSNSPFLPQSGSVGALTENSPLELRGIMPMVGGVSFGFFDPTKKRCGWVKLKETGREYTVLTYDPSNESVTVEYQGRVLTLALPASKIETMAAMPVPPPRVMTGPQGPGVAGAPSVDEARRLEAVAAEVARRRQQRQAAMQQAPQVQPPQQQPVPAPNRR